MLTAYAESDFKVKAKQLMKDGVHFTEGVFQQSDRYWHNNRLDVRSATNAFLDNFLGQIHIADTIADIWFTQQWDAPSPRISMEKFKAAPETLNYVYRLEGTHGFKPISMILRE